VRHRHIARLIAALLVASLGLPAQVVARDPEPAPQPPAGIRQGPPLATTSGTAPRSDQVIIRYRAGTTGVQRANERARRGLARVRSLAPDLDVVRLPVSAPLQPAALVRGSGVIAEAVPDGYVSAFVDPTAEPAWAWQWGHHNTGQLIRGYDASYFYGVPDVDIDGLEALDVTAGSGSVVVAVIDDGVDFGHPDLDGRAWTNPGETGLDEDGFDKATNGKDDDGNGYVDDVRGWDFCNNDNTVHDFNEDWHGTAVAGVIAAEVDGFGTVGVAPETRIMALKFLQQEPDPQHPRCGQHSMAIAAIRYARSFGVPIINASWGGPGANPVLKTEIEQSGALFVAAAGNDGANIDTHPIYPAAFDSPNILTIAAIHNEGGLASFSNYGKTSVDVSAPGEGVLGPCPADAAHPSPGTCWLDGTSFAAPYTTGVAALAGAAKPTLLASPTSLRSRVLTSAVPLAATNGLTATGRLVNARRAIDVTPPIQTGGLSVLPAASALLGSGTVTARLSWPAASDDLAMGSYRVEVSRNGGAWTTLATTTARTLDQVLAFSGTYQFRVTARDAAGNATAPLVTRVITPVRYEETTSLAKYAGSWSSSTQTSASGGKTRFTSGSGASVTFSFNGRTGALVAPLGPTKSSLKVYVDGAYVKTISLYASTTRPRTIVYTTGTLGAGTHTLKLVNVRVGSRIRADVDAFVVLR
jgi:subtilisin family serine protease